VSGLQGRIALRQYLNAALLLAEFQAGVNVLDFAQGSFCLFAEIIRPVFAGVVSPYMLL
jgi:hypothetical protein